MKHWRDHNIHECDLLQVLYKMGITQAALLLITIQMNDGLRHMLDKWENK